jgi:hypothetical protein
VLNCVFETSLPEEELSRKLNPSYPVVELKKIKYLF